MLPAEEVVKRLFFLFIAISIFSLICFAQDATTPPVDRPVDTRAVATTADKQINTDAELPQTASPLPLYGILAVGFLCAGYMTLRTN
jgi:hypothetical protein